jgi:hypothetical protein
VANGETSKAVFRSQPAPPTSLGDPTIKKIIDAIKQLQVIFFNLLIDEHRKRAGRRPIFKPAMVRAVDLDLLADMFTTMTRLLDALALRPRSRRARPAASSHATSLATPAHHGARPASQ